MKKELLFLPSGPIEELPEVEGELMDAADVPEYEPGICDSSIHGTEHMRTYCDEIATEPINEQTIFEVIEKLKRYKIIRYNNLV